MLLPLLAFERLFYTSWLLADTLSCTYASIGPTSKGHSLVIPKYHGERLHDIPDEYLSDLLVVAKKLAKAQGVVDYNVLQNNGSIAHQVVMHVHVHMIPKPNKEEGLIVGWPGTQPSKEELQEVRY